MHSLRILMVLAMTGAGTVSSQAATIANDAMNDYNMESSISITDDDLFGFQNNSTIRYRMQFTFTNTLFLNSQVATLNLTGFDVYSGANRATGTLVASTGACTGLETAPADPLVLVCGTPAGVVLSGFPYSVYLKAGSQGLIRRANLNQIATLEVAGIPGGTPSSTVPEPSTAALAGLGVVLAGWLRRRSG